jgi:hypothetical protein
MTTTVCDLLNRILAADTRWSCGSQGEFQLSDGKKYFVFCDSTGFDKISIVGKAALVTAGSGPLISEWKKWWAGKADPSQRPATHDSKGVNLVSLAIIDLKDSKYIFDAGRKTALYCTETGEIKAFTSGSGAHHAASSLLIYADAMKAVNYAAEHDFCTGEDVIYACYKTNRNNLNNDVNDYSVIVDGIVQRGKIMILNQNRPNYVGSDISIHPLADEIKKAFSTGQAVASAPVPGLNTFEWTAETDSDFQDAMKRVHELRKI